MSSIHDPSVHARFLGYRERHVYFGRGEQRVPLTAEAFARLDDEHRMLSAKVRDKQTAAQSARLAEIATLLHLD